MDAWKDPEAGRIEEVCRLIKIEKRKKRDGEASGIWPGYCVQSLRANGGNFWGHPETLS